MKFVTSALALALVSTTAIATAQAQQITGAGSSFAAPLYTKWGEAAAPSTHVTLNYQSIGSGAGQNQIFNRTVDFGASDAPVPHDKLVQNNLIQFPSAMGAVVVIVNIPGVETNKLKLTGELLAEIYQGKITHWNDPKLAEMNRGVKLPRLTIAPVYRADGSGTTFVFTDYLSMLSSDWKSAVGANTSVQWPAGQGAKGNDGVAGTVHNTRGGIGYVEAAYAAQNHLTTTLLRNKAGKFVEPTMATYLAAAASADWSHAQDFAIDLNDQAGDQTWPIESATYVLLPTNPKDAAQSAAVMKFFDYGFMHGDEAGKQLLYVTLPQSVKDAVRAEWHAQVKGPDGKPVM
jgi:phosphate transport system substrate-binding protein